MAQEFGETPTPKEAKKKNTWIIVVAVLIILCCFCAAVAGAGWWLWINGDRLLQQLGVFLQLPVEWIPI